MNVSEVLALYNTGRGQTTYEKENGITPLGPWNLYLNAGDILFFIRKKSDGSTTLLIIFRAGKTDNYCGFMPNEAQFTILCDTVPRVISEIDQINGRARGN